MGPTARAIRRVLATVLILATLALPRAVLANDNTASDNMTLSFTSGGLSFHLPFYNQVNGTLTMSSLVAGGAVSGSGYLFVGDTDTGILYSGAYTATSIVGIYDFDSERVGRGTFHSIAQYGPDAYSAAFTFAPSSTAQKQDLWIYCGNAEASIDVSVTLSSTVSTAFAAVIKARNGQLNDMPAMTGTVSGTALC